MFFLDLCLFMQMGRKRDFEVGEEVQVKCSSFSSKGVPVMSMLDTD